MRLRIVGTGVEQEALEESIDHHGLGGTAELTGRRSHENLPDEYAWADVVAVPSVVDSNGDRDGLPNVTLEAMACGRPLVASDVSALGVTVHAAGSGLVVPPADADALAEALDHPDGSAVARRAGDRRPPVRRGALRPRDVHPSARRASGAAARPSAEGRPMRDQAAAPGPRRLRAEGLPAALRGVHHQRDLPAGATRRAAAPVRAQGGGRGGPPRRRTAPARRGPTTCCRRRRCPRRGLLRWLGAEPGAVPARPAAHGRAATPWAWPARPAQALAQAVRATAAASSPRPASSTSRSSSSPSTWPTGSTRAGTCAGCTRTSRTERRRSPGWPRRSPACRSRSPATRRTSTPRSSTRPACCDARWTPPRSSSTCTEANRRHLTSLGSADAGARRLPRPQRRLRAAGRGGCATATTPGRVRLLAVGRLVRKKGLDTFVDACAVLRDRGVDFEAVIVGEAGEHEQEVRARVAADWAGGPGHAPGPADAGRALRGVPPGQRVRTALPGARGRRPRRHPERARWRRWPAASRWSPRASPASPSWCVTA